MAIDSTNASTTWIRRLCLVCAWLAGCTAMPPAEPDLAFSHPVVLLGEVHDNAAQHALRLRAFEAWLRQGARPALLMEQFDRDRQGAIDRLRAQPSAPDADALIDAAAPGRHGWNWSYYRPFVALALQHGLPIVAVNVPRVEARAVMRQGLAAAGFDAALPPGLQAAIADTVRESHCGQIDQPTALRMALAQVARDQAMARAVEAHADRGVLLLAGNEHVRNDVGVPRWLSPATRRRSNAIGMLEFGDPAPEAFDRVVFTSPQPREDPCLAMRPPARG